MLSLNEVDNYELILFLISSKQSMKNVIKTGLIGHGIQQTWDRLDVGLVDGTGKYLRKYRCIS